MIYNTYIIIIYEKIIRSSEFYEEGVTVTTEKFRVK